MSPNLAHELSNGKTAIVSDIATQQIQYPFHVEVTEDSKGLAKVTASVRSLMSAHDAKMQCVELFVSTKNELKQRGVKVAE